MPICDTTNRARTCQKPGLESCRGVLITDKLRSYGAAKRVVMPGVAHRQHRYLNNRAENSHQPTRERERRMRRFKSARHAQRFVEVHGIVASHFRPRRHLLSAPDYRQLRNKRFRFWNEVTGTSALAWFEVRRYTEMRDSVRSMSIR
jgi:putative transposase